MSLAHTRKKQPELVRRTILDCAGQVIAEHGMAGLSIKAVADAAGVSKGGVFHHFPNRQALIEAMLHDLLEQGDRDIDTLMATDPIPYGRFTRAYIRLVLSDDNPDRTATSIALVQGSLFDPQTGGLWNSWLHDRLHRHAETDSDPALEVPRLAADGAWLITCIQNALPDAPHPDFLRSRLPALTERLLAMTYGSK